jgi:hypothetical protein
LYDEKYFLCGKDAELLSVEKKYPEGKPNMKQCIEPMVITSSSNARYLASYKCRVLHSDGINT